MALLKKIKASTLMETLVATVLIVIIFMLSSMILNTIFSSSIKNNTQSISTYLNELHYLQKHKKIELPYYEDFENWRISIVKFSEDNKKSLEFEAVNSETEKTITIIVDEG
ncbi:hypothetical protein ESY86_09570 [Subsaximicrobium wynnwilliamsii]|uniref:Type II secretion system protein n=1 Tax=Subsaximicrobium wynnwilliamsii TaxID=291179 RepID=A0A5C6ZJH1_9FLAO|nr:hypothetical protein [Subsaximicrobium wynnwilliamsii]TXD83445.1 hypothetical protein ESY87_09240 [Subsaximicrobium wynnwilliamsii]TXD89280.1 hypothetical protein ESY86_09570 [Subsaximicrobium wynnwilliamsii]TXE03125.1 hypothetical protein ESY88_08950 [Subsaximicrobium wynnwilliamsii]